MKVKNDRLKKNLLKTFDEASEIIVFDTETTGLSAEKNRIIQISAIKFQITNEGKLKEIARLDEYINPETPIVKKITEITGITNEFIKDKPNEETVFPKVFKFFGTNPSLVAYNSSFDLRFLRAMYIRNNKPLKVRHDVDVLKIARELINKEDIDNHKLATVAKHFYCDRGLTFHSAIDDTIATARVFAIFIKMYRDEEPVITEGKRIANIIDANYWAGFGWSTQRIYVNTDLGSVYYNIKNRNWGTKNCDVDTVNMAQLVEDLLKFLDVSDMDEAVKVIKGKDNSKQEQTL